MASLFTLTEGKCDCREPHNYIDESDLKYLIEHALPRSLHYENAVLEQHDEGICLVSQATYECSQRMWRRMSIDLQSLKQVYAEIQEVKARTE